MANETANSWTGREPVGKAKSSAESGGRSLFGQLATTALVTIHPQWLFTLSDRSPVHL